MDSKPALEWREDKIRDGHREETHYYAVVGDLSVGVEPNRNPLRTEGWVWYGPTGTASGYVKTVIEGQLAAEDWLRAQRDALAALGEVTP